VDRPLEYENRPALDRELGRVVGDGPVPLVGDGNRILDGQLVDVIERRTVRSGAFNRFNDILPLDIEQGVAMRDGAE
jgi:hypothetical protein